MHVMHLYAVPPVNYELLVHNDIPSNQREDLSRPSHLEVDRKVSLLLLHDFVTSYLSTQIFFNLKTNKQRRGIDHLEED